MGIPRTVTADSDTKQLPQTVRQRLAQNLTDPNTIEGAAVAEVVAAAGGGGGSALSYDPDSFVYSVPAGSTITYDPTTGSYSSN